MKCAVFNGKCNMTIDEREIPEPAADEVLIKIMACGVCGSDVHIFFGDQGSTSSIPPLIQGHEFSGVVVKIGKDVVTRIIAVDVQEKRLQKALELGATDVINGKEKDTVKEIFRLTGGAGADLTIETAGTEITTRQAINFAKPGSTIVLVGYSASGEETLPMSLALDKELTFKTVFRYRHIYPVAIEAVAAGSINVKGIVSNVWDFDDIENAMIQSVKDKANIVKSVIKIG